MLARALLAVALVACESADRRARPPPPAPAIAFQPPADAAVPLDAAGDAAVDAAVSVTTACGTLGLGETFECAVDGAGDVTCAPTKVTLVKVEQIDLGYQHGCARSGTTASCWGYGELGQLGNGGRSSRAPVAVSLSDVVDIDVGHVASCARTTAGAVTCWGMLGTTSEPAFDRKLTRVPLAAPATDLDVGGATGCAVLDDGSVQCWDKPRTVTSVAGLPAARSVSVAGTACAITRDDKLWCWDPNVRKPVARRAKLDVPVVRASGSCALTRTGDVWCEGYPFGCPPSTRTPAGPPRASGFVKVPFASPIANLYTGPTLVCGQASDGSVQCQGCRATGVLLAKPAPLAWSVAPCAAP